MDALAKQKTISQWNKSISLLGLLHPGRQEKGAMATGSGFASESPSSATSEGMDRLKTLYPAVNEDESPLPHSWSSKDKYSYIGLSQNNLRVHYKGSVYL